MTRATAITLIRDEPRGVHEDPVQTARVVPCLMYSIGEKEHFDLRDRNLQPACKVELGDVEEYKGEKRCTIGGEAYRIERTYVTDHMTIELTLVRDQYV